MSEAYTIDGVTITPKGGGVYELSHPKLENPIKERGKDDAEARAKTLAAELAADATMAPQTLDDLKPVQPTGPSEAEQIAQLKAQLAQAEADKLDALSKLQTRTVITDGEAPEVPLTKIPAGVPRKFDGVLDDKAKAEIKRLGVEMTDIILEENESIPPTGLFLGHNGRGYMIVPGDKVTVPNFLLEVLDNAVMSAPVMDSKTQKVLGYRNRMRYPYRRV